jgi:UDP-N-acetylmuramoylalanine--D-glutamate ligase
MEKLNSQKVAVLGFGLEGKDLCDFLLSQEAKITVFDQKQDLSADQDYQDFKKQGVDFRLGENCLEPLADEGFAFIFRSPGFSSLRPEIKKAKDQGSQISSAVNLFFEQCSGKIIGVTGTKGKGTTATLISEILKKDGQKVFLAGNVGQPVLSLLDQIKADDWVVLELSSFQLMDLGKSPHIAVVLFISSEHLNYHQDNEEYIQSKANIVSHQTPRDLAVLNADNSNSSSFASLTKGKVYYFSRQKKVNGSYVKDQIIYLFDQEVGSVEKLGLLGEHNWDNVCAAVLAAHLAGVSLEPIRETIFAFKGLGHRLEPVRKFEGVSFYNDSFSTTPETTIAAIKSFKKPLVLIAGGSDKGSDYQQLGQEIAKSTVKTLILIGQMADKINQSVLEAGFKGKIILRPSEKMAEIVKLAFEEGKPGGIVLLSPACASFDLFADYKDRGEQFKKNVQSL